MSARHTLGVVHAFDETGYQSEVSVWEELPRQSPKHPGGFHELDIVMFKKALNQKDTK